ncbi:hypothetical protein BN3661_00105 [Eubacteriaceae bacterium CHKCI005]|nr:hypothetical protein BN3661_00105 [Eubacteriaceae bacterium CHKCI005]
MRNSAKVTLGGMIAGLSVVCMFLTRVIPTMTYALPAIAGALLILLTIEAGTKWALGAFAVTAVLSFVLAVDPQASILYVAFLGYYPILKSWLERIPKRWIEWVVKFALFNVAAVASYWVTIWITGVPDDFLTSFGAWGPVILLALGNVTFLIYDYALTKVITLYMYRFHKRVRKLFHA